METHTRVFWVAFGPIGDALMMLALFDRIRKTDPAVRCTVLTSRNTSAIRDLASCYPYVDVIDMPRTAAGALMLVAQLVRHPWSVCVGNVAGKLSLRLKCFIAFIGLRSGTKIAGFSDGSSWLPFDACLAYEHFGNPYIDQISALARAAGCSVDASLPVAVHIKAEVPKSIPLSNEGYIVVHLFGTRKARSLPPRRWHALLAEIINRYPTFQVVVTGITPELERIDAATQGLAVTIALDIPLLEFAGLLRGARAYLGPDTGITHLACVLAKEVVEVGNLTNTTWLPTYCPHARILYVEKRCLCRSQGARACASVEEDGVRYNRCVYDIPDERIIGALDDALLRAVSHRTSGTTG